MRVRINEKTSFVYRARLHDENKVAITLASITTLKLTHYLAADAAVIINTRNAQNALNANNVTYTEANGVLTAASNASPIVVTSTAHGRKTDDIVFVRDVLGNDAANGLWQIVKVDANNFKLARQVQDVDGEMQIGAPSRGNGAYTSGGSWSHSLLEWQMQSLDNAIVGGTPIWSEEEHVSHFQLVYSGGQVEHELHSLVLNLAKA